jgi:hypothetical protein
MSWSHLKQLFVRAVINVDISHNILLAKKKKTHQVLKQYFRIQLKSRGREEKRLNGWMDAGKINWFLFDLKCF